MDTLIFFMTAVIFLVAADIVTIVFLLKFRFLKNKAEKEVIRRNETEDLLKSVFSSMTEGLLVVNKEGKVILFNQAAAILLKMAPGEAVGKKIEDVFYIFKQKFGEKERLNSISGFLKKIIDKPDIITVGMSDNFYCKSKSGREYPVGAVMASLLKNGQSIGATIIFRNIAREKEVDRAKSEFVSLASHQLQTPLAAINWYAETLLDGDLGQLKKSQE